MQELDILSPAGTARMFIGLLGDQCKAKRPMEMRFYLYSTLKWRLRFSSDKRRNLSKKAGNSIVVSERHPPKIDQKHIAKSKMGYISLSSILNAIIGITSYYCVILKMVILHDAIKTIQNGDFVFFLKKEQKPVIKKYK